MATSDTQNTQGGGGGTPDLSQYIRTYAKDVAKVSGKGNVGAIQKSTPPPKPAAVPVPPPPQKQRGEVSDGVEFDALEQPFFDRASGREEKGHASTPLELETRAELDSFVEPTGAGKTVVSTVVPAPTSPQAVEEERESVLARLRAKMASHPAPQVPAVPVTPPPPQISVPVPPPPAAIERIVPAPVFETPKEAPVYSMPPVYREPIPEPIPQATPAPAPVVAPIPAQKPQAAPTNFHSYSTDFADQKVATGASSFSVLAAQQDAAPREQPKTFTKGKRAPVLAIALGTVLLVLAAGGAYAAYLYVGSRQPVPTLTEKVPSLIFADEFKKVDGAGIDLMQALAMAASDPLVQGTALVTYVAQPATGEPGIIAGSPAPGGVLIKALNLAAPDLLLRNITEKSTVGVINEGGETRTFFVLRVSSYERTFAGMLTWEPLMERELALLYPLYASEESDAVSLSTTTASSAPKATSQTGPVVSRARFEDAVVANRDVRILRDTRGRSLLLYGYADKETLIIARNEASFAALLTRLSAASQ